MHTARPQPEKKAHLSSSTISLNLSCSTSPACRPRETSAAAARSASSESSATCARTGVCTHPLHRVIVCRTRTTGTRSTCQKGCKCHELAHLALGALARLVGQLARHQQRQRRELLHRAARRQLRTPPTLPLPRKARQRRRRGRTALPHVPRRMLWQIGRFVGGLQLRHDRQRAPAARLVLSLLLFLRLCCRRCGGAAAVGRGGRWGGREGRRRRRRRRRCGGGRGGRGRVQPQLVQRQRAHVRGEHDGATVHEARERLR